MTFLPLASPPRMDFTLSTKPLLPIPVKYDKTFNPSTIYKTYGARRAAKLSIHFCDICGLFTPLNAISFLFNRGAFVATWTVTFWNGYKATIWCKTLELNPNILWFLLDRWWFFWNIRVRSGQRRNQIWTQIISELSRSDPTPIGTGRVPSFGTRKQDFRYIR